MLQAVNMKAQNEAAGIHVAYYACYRDTKSVKMIPLLPPTHFYWVKYVLMHDIHTISNKNHIYCIGLKLGVLPPETGAHQSQHRVIGAHQSQ